MSDVCILLTVLTITYSLFLTQRPQPDGMFFYFLFFYFYFLYFCLLHITLVSIARGTGVTRIALPCRRSCTKWTNSCNGGLLIFFQREILRIYEVTLDSIGPCRNFFSLVRDWESCWLFVTEVGVTIGLLSASI
jgi:hypothetical protein